MSPKTKPIVLRCPTCKTIVTAADEDFPFCSDRCRKIDLGKWASGAYKISSPILDPDVLEDLESGKRRIPTRMTNSTTASPAGKKTLWAWTIATFFGAGFWNLAPVPPAPSPPR